jgi:hypothetical protein
MRPSLRLALVLVAGASFASVQGCACADECDVGTARCVDDVTLETCFLPGPDSFAPVSPTVIDCRAPNAACVELPGDQAACVLEERTPCDEAFTAHCDGTRVLFCAYGEEGTSGFVAANECADQPGTGRCGEAPDAPGSAVCL